MQRIYKSSTKYYFEIGNNLRISQRQTSCVHILGGCISTLCWLYIIYIYICDVWLKGALDDSSRLKIKSRRKGNRNQRAASAKQRDSSGEPRLPHKLPPSPFPPFSTNLHPNHSMRASCTHPHGRRNDDRIFSCFKCVCDRIINILIYIYWDLDGILKL